MSKLKDFFKDFLGADVEDEIEINIQDNTAVIEKTLDEDDEKNFKKSIEKKTNSGRVKDVSELSEKIEKMKQYQNKNEEIER